MNEMELRELLFERLHMEIQLFKDSVLCKSKADIYSFSYKIELYVNLYEILVIQAERMSAALLRKLIYQPSGILEAFYQEWLSKDDNFYTELREYVEDELDVLLAIREVINAGKEDGDGEERDKAA